MNRESSWLCGNRGCALLLALSFAATAGAHIKNEATQFPDIEYSPARFDIVVLVGVGIIPETPVFEPERPLERSDFATWLALAEGLLPGGETPDTDALAAAALDTGLIDSLDGAVTLGELNRTLLGGALELDDETRVPSKAEAASLIAANLDLEAARSLLSKRNLAYGPTGTVSSVEVREGHHGNRYFMTIADTTLPMDEHGRVANGPTDLLQWESRVVRRSIIRGAGEDAMWIFLEAEPLATVPVDPVTRATDPEVAPAAVDRRLLIGLVVIVVVLGVVLFFRRSRSG